MDPTHRDVIERVTGTAISRVEPLDGGQIGTVERVRLADGQSVVAKTGETPLSVEARMLEYLHDRGLPVPEVRHATDDLLVLPFVSGGGTVTPAVERDAATRLAALHARSADAFGFPFDTLSGPIEQPNPWTDSWAVFYRERRLRPLIDRLSAADAVDPSLVADFEAAVDSIDALVTEPSRPALLHGDVWRGNVRTDGERITAFLDPACYYGHPEIELAYVDWTDAFGEAFFETYAERAGIEPGFFERRRYAYRLYPLAIHAVLFGDPYPRKLADAIRRCRQH